jgi:hypothetical protein
MKRRLFNIATTVSLVLCVATAALWLLSYRTSLSWTADWVKQGSGSHSLRTFALTCESGQCLIGGIYHHSEGPRDVATNRTFNHSWSSRSPRPPAQLWPRDPMGYSVLGFGWKFRPQSRRGVGSVVGLWGVMVPCWFAAVVFAVLPANWGTRRIKSWRRDKRRRCVHCGYDLRATPDRCPECGAAVREPPHNPPCSGPARRQAAQ